MLNINGKEWDKLTSEEIEFFIISQRLEYNRLCACHLEEIIDLEL